MHMHASHTHARTHAHTHTHTHTHTQHIKDKRNFKNVDWQYSKSINFYGIFGTFTVLNKTSQPTK